MDGASGEPRFRGAILIGGITILAVAVMILISGGVSYPALFMALAAVMLLLALAALWASFRSAFAGGAGEGATRTNLPERAALVDEKNALVRAIKDIEYEHQVGKLSKEDFSRLDRGYRARAREVLRKLDDDIAPFVTRAEKMVGDYVAVEDAPKTTTKATKKTKGTKKAKIARRVCSRCGTSNAADAEWCKECRANVAPVSCPSCDTANEPDAKFCKKCAAPMAISERAAEEKEKE
jgi:hypothetical protein